MVANVACFVVVVLDKWKARHGAWRVPEITLIMLMWAGGALGGWIAMLVASHKIRKVSFLTKAVAVSVLNAGWFAVWLGW